MILGRFRPLVGAPLSSFLSRLLSVLSEMRSKVRSSASNLDTLEPSVDKMIKAIQWDKRGYWADAAIFERIKERCEGQ